MVCIMNKSKRSILSSAAIFLLRMLTTYTYAIDDLSLNVVGVINYYLWGGL